MSERILFICHDGDLYGSQRSLSLIVAHLPPEHYQCFVSMARSGPLQAVLESYPNVQVLRHQRLQWVKHDPRNWLQKIGDVISLVASAFPRTWLLFNTIRREKINLVHTNVTVSLEGALAAALAGVPHVWHIRELFMEKNPKFHMVLGRALSRRIIDRFSDQVICISHAVRDQFGPCVEEDPDKYRLIYNAMTFQNLPSLLLWNDHQRAMMKSLSLASLRVAEQDVFRLGYIGRLSAGKGLHELLAALAILRQRGYALQLLVAGSFVDAPYEERIQAMVQHEGLADAVVFLGYQSDLTPMYEVLDLLVVPSVNEPFGRVVIEAMANGVPCIGANAGGIPEIIEHEETGWLYPPGDVWALADMIEPLTSTFWKLETIRQNARRMVCERFNIETQIRMLQECYQSAMNRHQF
ncbi:glycosyltransferase family 4 protein [Vampirovibrio sp.]|uniref:glycosyltransferase family 4 protein n=1 Tax=Vampirovibrio sp. TaxID=2717857 RepID=UPI003592FA28